MTRAERLIMLSANPEAALKKYQEDKAAASQRKLAEERGKAIEASVGCRSSASRSRRCAPRAGGPALARAEQRLGRIRETLGGNKYFPDKALLDTDEPALIEPVTGHAWLKGRGFELDPSAADAPVHWAADTDKPSKWVVTEVDRDEGKIIARPYGSIGGHGISIEVGAMKSGVTPFAYDAAAEQAELDAEAARVKAAAGAKVAASIDDAMNTPHSRICRRRSSSAWRRPCSTR